MKPEKKAVSPCAVRCKSLRLISGFLALFVSVVANAGTCEMASTNPLGNQPIVATMPMLGGNLTVGRDQPLGSEIYRQTFNPFTGTNIHCVNLTTTILERNSFSSTPLPLAPWSGTPYGGRVYQSGVPGIGVAIWFRSDTLPYNWAMTNCASMMANCVVDIAAGNMAFVVSLIKIGDVTAGTINGANFPSIIRDLVTDNVLTTVRLNFSGSLNIVSRTCQTPDVNVPMGTHMLNEFSGRNTFTQWKDFSIALNNCPAFNGFYQGAGPGWSNNGSVTGLDTRKNNVLQVRLDPTRTAITPNLGIMSLNPSSPGEDPAATGVGLQIADSHGTPLPLATLRTSGITPRAVEGASYTIPLKARYIQTADSITAGPANATATFTINYY